MDLLILIKCLLFLEGLLLPKFSPLFLLAFVDPNDQNAFLWQYALGYIFAFAWVWFTDRTRKISVTLITTVILSVLLKSFKEQIFHLPFYNFLYISCTAMIVPLTCAFTMMQLSPIQERERWPLQYVFLIIGKFIRTCFIDKHLQVEYEILIDVVATVIFVILAALIPWIQQRKLALDGTKRPVQIYSPISALLSQSRYLSFLLSVIVASFFFFYTRKSIDLSQKFTIFPSTYFITEICVCVLAYFVTPHRIAPQAFFLIGQALIGLRCIAGLTVLSLHFAVVIEMISAMGFTITSIANAQIIATHARPGLEFTTCALVDICKSGIAPVIFILSIPLITLSTAVLGCILFLTAFSIKYYFIDYPHDNLIKKKLI